MELRRFAPLGRDLSRLVLGTAAWTRRGRRTARALTETWLDLGGTAFDTARAYGESERVLGACLRDAGSDAIVITKAGHHLRSSEGGELVRRVTPEAIAADLETSLRTLGLDTVDVLLLHRDDPTRPVGPILEALNGHVRAGRIRSFGASNWTPARLAEANGYAREHGLEPFTSSSPQLSLAAWTEPPWPECVTARDPESLAWYERTGVPLLAWSPLAVGYDAGFVDPQIPRVFDTPANAARRGRAAELARRHGATATQVALAWVLAQPAVTAAVIGPRTVAELREAVGALDLELTPEELRLLDSGEP
jgi:aryl-alcohol dehydrogenase-like predicted oxidoreductase